MTTRPTYQLLSEARTVGIFQLEGRGVRDLLRKLQPEVFEDLVALVALYRPGPLGSGMVDDFIERRHGRRNITYEVPTLEPILRSTYGVIVFQEQVMQIATTLAGFTPGGADLLRRAMGKKKAEVMDEQREHFVQGAVQNGYAAAQAGRIFDLMAYFAGYGFNRSHSVAYALLAYCTAYLKAHFPNEFMAALMGCDMENTDKLMRYVGDCRDMGLTTLAPNINDGLYSFAVSGEHLRFGLGAVKGVGQGRRGVDCRRTRGERAVSVLLRPVRAAGFPAGQPQGHRGSDQERRPGLPGDAALGHAGQHGPGAGVGTTPTDGPAGGADQPVRQQHQGRRGHGADP